MKERNPDYPNLIRKMSTEQAQRIGSKGGKSRSLAKLMINRKLCISTCPLFNNCWAKHISYSLFEKVKEKAEADGMILKEIRKLKPKCALKSMPTSVIEGTKRIIIDGEEGFNNEMMEQIVQYKNDIMTDKITPWLREKYLFQLRKTKKSIYGDKSRIETDINKNELTADDFAVAYEEHKAKQKVESELKSDSEKKEDVNDEAT